MSTCFFWSENDHYCLLAFWNHTINPPSNGRKIAFWGTPQHKYYLWDNSMEVSEYKEVVYLFTNSGVKWLKTPPQSGCQCTIANLIMNRVLIGRWKWPLIMSGVAELQSISMTYMKRRSCGEMETKGQCISSELKCNYMPVTCLSNEVIDVPWFAFLPSFLISW